MLQEDTTWNIARLFFAEPTKEHYLKEISRKIGISHTSVIPNLKLLLKEEIIEKKVDRKGKRQFPVYYAKRDGEKFKFFKKISNILSLREAGIIRVIEREFTPNSIILFGSYSRGEDIEDSGIDLFVQSSEKKLDLSNFNNSLHRKINLYFNPNFGELPKELRNNMLNGIILSGFVEAFK